MAPHALVRHTSVMYGPMAIPPWIERNCILRDTTVFDTRFFRRMARQRPRLPVGRRVYAIGDIHGELELLEGLLRQIHHDDESRPGAAGELVFLGDLIDRGPHSAQVIDRLLQLRETHPGTRFLLGNHEQSMLASLEGDIEALRRFVRMGGRETIISYGVSPHAYQNADFQELCSLFKAAVPSRHRSFLQSFEHLIIAGDYVFVHAGVRPNVRLEEQNLADLLQIRQEFLRSRSPCDKVVVHGHSVDRDVVTLPHRIGLDTGAFRYGTLSAMGFEGTSRWVLQERREFIAPGSRGLAWRPDPGSNRI